MSLSEDTTPRTSSKTCSLSNQRIKKRYEKGRAKITDKGSVIVQGRTIGDSWKCSMEKFLKVTSEFSLRYWEYLSDGFSLIWRQKCNENLVNIIKRCGRFVRKQPKDWKASETWLQLMWKISWEDLEIDFSHRPTAKGFFWLTGLGRHLYWMDWGFLCHMEQVKVIRV